MASQANDGMSHIGGDVPANHHEALYQLAKHRDANTPRSINVSMASLLRDAVELYLESEVSKGDVPEEVRDLLDEDLLANAGGTEEAEA